MTAFALLAVFAAGLVCGAVTLNEIRVWRTRQEPAPPPTVDAAKTGEPVFVGISSATATPASWTWPPDPPTVTGVREPLRPIPPSNSAAVALHPPRPRLRVVE